MARKQPKPIQMMTNAQWEKAFPDEDACDAYLTANRWPAGKVTCPRCGSEHVYKMLKMAWKWECMDCGKSTSYRFSDITGTIFENTNVDLRKWFRVIHLILTAKKGVSALQVQRFMGFGSYKTAWYMCHRIRVALQDTQFQQLMGIVEVDETFIGGKAQNRHKGKRGGGKGGGGGAGGKAIVVGAVERKGNVVARVVADVSAATLNKFIRETVSDKVSLLCTDQWTGYGRVGMHRPHASVDHHIGEYIRHDPELVGAVHTQTIEGFWSIFKRQVIGTHHKISRKYLPLYVAECQFKYNNRHNAAIFETAIAGC